jgi:hypothetical protein
MIAGTFVLMWITTIVWKSVARGHPRAITWVLTPILAGLALLFPDHLRVLGITTSIAYALFLAGIYSQRPLIEWITGGFAALASIWLVVSVGAACSPGCFGGAVLLALSGALFLGATTHGMVLGHWYLNQPRLPLEPLKGATKIMFVSLGPVLATGTYGRAALLEGSIPLGILSPSTSSYWWTWVILVALTGGLGLMIRATVWSRSTQSATGLLYVAMVPAIGAQFLLDLLLTT